jgi:urease accessory protein
MTRAELEPGALLFLLQVSGGAFPTGAFAHSLGFETLMDSGEIETAADFEAVALDWLSFALAPVDGIAVGLAHAAAAANAPGELAFLDEQLTALKPAREAYDASTMVGRAFLDAASELSNGPALAAYRQLVFDQEAAGHGAIAFAVGCVDHRVPLDVALLAYLQSAFSALALVAARLVPLGQRDIQRVLYRAHPRLLAAARRASEATVNDMGSATAAIDIGAMRHERLSVRLCIS